MTFLVKCVNGEFVCMQVALANKADNTALAALRELIEKSGGGLGGDNGKVY